MSFAPEPPPDLAAAQQQALLLLVDDMPDNLQVLECGLMNDYRLVVARHGERALHLAAEKRPDLILLDVMMPELDGFEVCGRLKQNPETADIPVIFLTALNDENSEKRGLELGAVDYIHKPFNMALVRTRVATHLQASQARQALRAHALGLEQAAKLRDEVDRVLRHDLKAPLSPIIGFVDLMIDDDNLTEEQHENLQLIRDSGHKMLGMIHRSLDIYKMETKRYHYNPVPSNLHQIVQSVVSSMRILAKQMEVGLEFDCDASADAPFPVEEMLLHMMLYNLVQNAIEASSPGDVVKLHLTRDDAQVTLTIHNPAVVPDSIRDRFFEKYATSGKRQGTGLGTYSAHLMAETMGGTLTMTSSTEAGTQLTLVLPEPKIGEDQQ